MLIGLSSLDTKKGNVIKNVWVNVKKVKKIKRLPGQDGVHSQVYLKDGKVYSVTQSKEEIENMIADLKTFLNRL